MKRKLSNLRLPVWGWISLAVGLLALLALVAYMQPSYAGWRYGACRVFLDRYVRFPSTIDIKIGSETETSALIGFSDMNPYGAEQIRVFECYYSRNAAGRVTLSRLTMDRKPLPDDVVRGFDDILPIVLMEDLDTKLPGPLPDDLADMKE